MEHQDFARLKVLVIDDQAFVRGMVVRMLRSLGCRTVVEASDGGRALLLLGERPDLVISDIGMRPMTGIELLARLRRHPASATTPVIILTARPDGASVREAMALGADAYIITPVAAAALSDKIRQVMARAQLSGRRGMEEPPSTGTEAPVM